MVPCLKNIFYELLIARQRSYRRQQICRFQVFPPLTPLSVEMFRTRLRTRYRDLDVFVLFSCWRWWYRGQFGVAR